MSAILLATAAAASGPGAHGQPPPTGKEHIVAKIPEKLLVAGADYLNRDTAHWWVRDATNSYGKLDLDGLYWLIDSDDRSVMVAERRGVWTPLAPPIGLPLASELLARAHGNTPWDKMGLDAFAKTLASWFSDPRLYLTNEAFMRKQERVISSWLAGQERNPDAFRALRREAELKRTGDKWTLEFQAINRKGGVGFWSIEGHAEPFRVERVAVTPVRPDGTFYFPDEL